MAACGSVRQAGRWRQARLLLWLKRRHARRALTWFGYAAGTDLDAHGDVVERIYQLYLLVMVVGAAGASWAAVLNMAVQLGAHAGRLGFVPDLGVAVLAVPAALALVLAVGSLASPPFKLTSADVTFIASGRFDTRIMAAVDMLVQSMITVLAVAAFTYVELTALFAALAAAPAASVAAVGEVSVASMAGISVAAGLLPACLGVLVSAGGYVSVRVAPSLRNRALVGAAVIAVSVTVAAALLFGLAPSAVACIYRVVALAPAGVPLCLGLLGAFAVAMAATCGVAAHRADLACVIERSGAYASRSDVRLVALIAPDTYRELRRRYRVSHRRFRPAIPLGTGKRAYGRRAVLSHLRQFEGLPRLVLIGAVLCPAGALMLVMPLHVLLRVSWAYMVVAAAASVRELSLAFREDQRVRLVRDALPVGTRELMLRDGAPACLVVTVLSLAATGALVALVPAIPLRAVVLALLLSPALALSAAFDGAQFPRKRREMSSGMVMLVLAVACVVLSLAPAGVLELGIVGYIAWALVTFGSAV